MKVLPRMILAGALAHLAPAFAETSKEAIPPPSVQEEFDGFIKKFRVALKANDSGAVASMTRLPLGYDNAVRDAAQFRAVAYPRDFTTNNRACIQHGKAVYDRDGLNNENYFIFCGEEIFTFTKTPAGFLFTEVGMND